MEERGNQLKHEEEEEEIVCLDASFFVDDNYQLTKFTFGSQDIHLFCLHSASSITGILCSRFCHKVVMTDHNEEVLKILKKNIELHSCPENVSSISHELVAEKLEWGNTGQINEILRKHPGGFDFILGADIFIRFQQSSIPMLFDSVRQLLRAREGRKCKFILAYVSRAKTMDSMIIIEASKLRMKMKEVTGTRCIVGNLEGVVFEVTLE
ncbi:uncharacterized protein LOC106761258 isoform X3 [Vigna radiata var. radiata]|uniref:Uncharacterized protein LOC106761258 isoform X3 n=1 Tax=Vigna radiata var. radiata TaxID=3916 RepID=A0A3Q0F0E6_VIGRR|nr:uncharacterized protein LOC106761258 isoform X3 [Vigna radiata var. radiata]